MSKKKFDGQQVDNSTLRTLPVKPKKVTRKPITADGIDVTKISGVESGNQSLSDFVSRLSAATSQKSKNFQMTIAEANALMANVSSIIVQNKELQDQIFELQNQLIEQKSKSMEKIVLDFDGGSFKN